METKNKFSQIEEQTNGNPIPWYIRPEVYNDHTEETKSDNQQDTSNSNAQTVNPTNNNQSVVPVHYQSSQQMIPQPIPSTSNQYQPYMNQNPIYPIYQPTYPPPLSVDEIELSLNDIRALNKEKTKADIEIYKKNKLALIDVQKTKLLNEEKLRAKKANNDYEDQRNPERSLSVIFENGNGSEPSKTITPKDAAQKFISERGIVKTRLPNKKTGDLMILSEDENRHVPISQQDLINEFIIFLEEEISNGTPITPRFKKLSSNLMLRSIPKLEKSKLTILKPHQAMFLNGYLDILEWEFTPISETERKKYYTIFSYDIEFSHTYSDSEPIAFNALLSDSLNGNQEAIESLYEAMGAIFTPVPTLKKIFAFQGVSNSGKTRISNIIASCIPYEDILILSGLAEISTDNLISRPIRLIQVQELSKNKITAKQIAKLKAYADGSCLQGASSFKILINTNYAITTDENGNIEPALKNRLYIIPFPKPMNNTDPKVTLFEDESFEKEKPLIIYKGLRAFSKVLKNNNKFSHEFEPNEFVYKENLEEQDFNDTSITGISVQQLINPSKQTQFEQFMNQLFALSEDVNLDMTVKNVMNIVNYYIPNEFKDEASAGKRIHDFFGNDKIKSKRNKDGIMCYNLILKSQTITE